MQYSRGSFFPIEVTETDKDYEVKIAPGEKERAKKIPGRRWDPQRTRWVFPKTTACYRRLRREFQRDAAKFNIRKPPVRPTPPPPPVDSRQDEFAPEEVQDKSRKPSDPSVRDRLEGLDESVKTILSIVNNVEKSARQTQSLVEDAYLPSETRTGADIDLTERANLKNLEAMLKQLACQVSGDPSFKIWIRDLEPVLNSDKFVMSTHNEISNNLRQMVGIIDSPRFSFPDIVSRLRSQHLLPVTRDLNVPQMLMAMNHHRNRFAHPVEFSDADRLTRSIIYLFNLALVWNHVASEPIDDGDLF